MVRGFFYVEMKNRLGLHMYARSDGLMIFSTLSFNSMFIFKGVLHLLPKISMFCALSQNNQQLFEK